MAFTLRRTPTTTRYYTEPLNGLNNAIPLQMVLIPGGTFTMGSPEDEPGRSNAEGPQHKVTISQFFMGRYPITQAQWRAISALPQIEQELEFVPPYSVKGDNLPVGNVHWQDAVELCARLSFHTGRSYRLPSEAEWEYACRAGTTTPFHFGQALTPEVANCNWDAIDADGFQTEAQIGGIPVDQFDVANAFGLYGMHGNVWEWCQDHWHDNYEGAPNDGSAWFSDNDEELHIRRGGCWTVSSTACRSAFRGRFPYVDGYSLGFRVVSAPSRSLP